MRLFLAMPSRFINLRGVNIQLASFRSQPNIKFLFQGNLIYAGINRGKKLMVLIGTKKALASATKNNKLGLRYTHLSQGLQCNDRI